VRHPHLVREIARRGHEIGSHGWSHDLVYDMTPERFRDETRRAVDVIGEVANVRARSYRAAFFSITKASFWALEVLASLGFTTDSSIFPVRNWRYGIPGFPPEPSWIETASGRILEIPLGVRRFGNLEVPISGGAYLRIYPYAVTRANLRAAEAGKRPQAFYIHPWELDPDHPRIPFHWKAWLTHYVNLHTTAGKLQRLLDDFQFGTVAEVFGHGPEDARSAAL